MQQAPWVAAAQAAAAAAAAAIAAQHQVQQQQKQPGTSTQSMSTYPASGLTAQAGSSAQINAGTASQYVQYNTQYPPYAAAMQQSLLAQAGGASATGPHSANAPGNPGTAFTAGAAPWLQASQAANTAAAQHVAAQQVASQQSAQHGFPAVNPYAAGSAYAAANPYAANPYGAYAGMQPRVWTGTVTQLIPPNYGIVDGDTFYVEQQVVGGPMPKVGDKVVCEAIPNTDGGQYKWRMTKLQLAEPSKIAATSMSTRGTTAGMKANQHLAPSSSAAASTRDNKDDRSKQTTYNAAPPPTTAYTADVAMAVAMNVMDSGKRESSAPPSKPDATASRPPPYIKPAPQLTDEEKKRAESAVQQYSHFGIGAQLLSKMGFGAKEGKGGLGVNGQGIAEPVDPKGIRGSVGLGFDHGPDRPPLPRHHHHRDRRDHERGRAQERSRRHKSRSRSRGSLSSRSRSSSHSSRSSASSRSRSRNRSSSRSRSPPRRYSCKPPKFPCCVESFRGTATVTKRYKDLYVPSEFSGLMCHAFGDANIEAVNAGHLLHPLEFIIDSSSSNSSTGSKPESKTEAAAAAVAVTPEPGTSSSNAMSAHQIEEGRRWSVRVGIYSGVPAESMLATSSKDYRHPMTHCTLLTCNRPGRKGSSKEKDKKEDTGGVAGVPEWAQFLPGGRWEPEDGAHPASNPAALINTAIRTVRSSVGVDLSACTQWTVLGEVVYYKAPSGHSRDLSAAVEEHTVLLLVDAWAAAGPNTAACQVRDKALQAVEAAESAKAAVRAAKQAAEVAEQAYSAAVKEQGGKGGVDVGDLELEPSKLTVAQLQEELTKRGLDTKWDPLKGKKQLVDRLQAYLDTKRTEQAAVSQETNKLMTARNAVVASKQKVTEAQAAESAAAAAAKSAKEVLKRYTPPHAIHVTPSPDLSHAGVSVAAHPLEKLLKHSSDNNDQGYFETALFAELFVEALTAYFGRALLRTLPCVAALKKDGDKDSSKDKKLPTAASSKLEEVLAKVAAKVSSGGNADAEAGKKRPADEGAAPLTSSNKKSRHYDDVQCHVGYGSGVVASMDDGIALQLVCRFFDVHAAGYLEQDDLEELLYMTCPTASRRQVQALVDTVTGKRGRFSYSDHPETYVSRTALPVPNWARGVAAGGALHRLSSTNGAFQPHTATTTAANGTIKTEGLAKQECATDADVKAINAIA